MVQAVVIEAQLPVASMGGHLVPPNRTPMRLVAATLLALCGSLVDAHAQAIIAQSSGLSSPAQVIDFGAGVLPNFTPVSTQFTGILITHAAYFTTGVSNNLVGGFLTNDFTAPGSTLRIQFATPVTDLSFVYHQISTSAPSVIRAVLQGVTIDSFSGTWNQSQPNNYFGFTNTVFDELQIDFVADFNVDTLAFNPVGSVSAACVPFNGSAINPPDFSCQTLPVLGTTWQGIIATNANTVSSALVYAPSGLAAPSPLFVGELLIQVSPSPIAFGGVGSYSWPLPSASIWAGSVFTFQGVRLDVVGGTPTYVLLNAMQLVVGF